MPWRNIRSNALIPNAWESSWTARRARWAVLNQKPSAWHIDEDVPPIGLRAPFGDGNSGWQNPCTTHTVPLTAGIDPTAAVLTANKKRNLLLIQNNSTATSPDQAPTLFVAFGQLAVVGQALGLPPGVGIVLDIICPRDAIYLVFGPSSGSSVVITGVVVEGALSQD